MLGQYWPLSLFSHTRMVLEMNIKTLDSSILYWAGNIGFWPLFFLFGFWLFCVGRHIFPSVWCNAHFDFPKWALTCIIKKLNNLAKGRRPSYIWNKMSAAVLMVALVTVKDQKIQLSVKSRALATSTFSHIKITVMKRARKGPSRNTFPPSQQHQTEELKTTRAAGSRCVLHIWHWKCDAAQPLKALKNISSPEQGGRGGAFKGSIGNRLKEKKREQSTAQNGLL